MSAIAEQHQHWFEAHARLRAGVAIGTPLPSAPQPVELIGPRDRDWMLVGNVWMGEDADYRVDAGHVPPPAPSTPPREVIRRRTVGYDSALHTILLQVAFKHCVTPRDIKSTRRDKLVVAARHEVMYRLKAETLMSLPAIGKRLNRDHTTVIHGINQHSKRLAAGTMVNGPLIAISDGRA